MPQPSPPHASIPNSFAAVRPRMSALSSSLRESQAKTWSTGAICQRERIIGAHDDLAGTGLGGEVAQCFRGEHDGIVIKLLQIFGRALLDGGFTRSGKVTPMASERAA